jgi:hypothetical protein
MEKTCSDDQVSEKKRYAEPVLTEVLLRPEEAVLGFCKTEAGAPGPLQIGCFSPVACSTPGS